MLRPRKHRYACISAHPASLPPDVCRVSSTVATSRTGPLDEVGAPPARALSFRAGGAANDLSPSDHVVVERLRPRYPLNEVPRPFEGRSLERGIRKTSVRYGNG